KSESLPLRRWPCWPGPYSRLFTGLFGRPQIFWPIRRSILYFASLRFVIASSFLSSSFEETRPPVRREIPGADRPNPLSLKGRTTGRETHRGPKSAREQARSYGETAVLSNERPGFAGQKGRNRRFRRRRADQVATARIGFGSACCLELRNSAAISV